MASTHSHPHGRLWSVSSELPALSGHVVLASEPTLHASQRIDDELRERLRTRFGIGHATLEPECHSCTGDDCEPLAAIVRAAPEAGG